MYKPFDLSGKVALISGGSGGIGFGMAEALAASGSDIVIWDIDGARAEEAAHRLEGAGVRVAACRVDVTSEDDVAEAMQAVVAEMGRIDTVIAAAGVLGAQVPFRETQLDAWRRVQAVNVEGLILTFREATKHMVDRAGRGDAGGSLIGVASIAAVDGTPRNEAYSASKGAVLSIMRSLAVEHARYGIRANAIMPGWIATGMTENIKADEAVTTRVVPRIPMRRWGTPDDLGGIAVYLASDASVYHTGDTFAIDGGYLIF